ncbi:poly(A)-specific ribonuclease PARN-like isoform X1 [Senna tora]|uniref:Poly(A)-specific ribonuclease PARN-like isoform X1 n=1 Tax=Senna tora TaxID=362788 RepID=A0A834XL12_9FABA|nr:poly(A)-specific ribonuclease PARN-like isoform X1 [Senna tora]
MVSASMSVLLLQRRSLCTKIPKQWKAKQITISNFQESLDEINTHISNSDFIAVSMQRTGSFSAPWQRLLPFDTAETAYCKAKDSAHRFQLLQFAVCPFSIASSNKLIAHPYNFHLFPRDELRLGMPAYSFSCQTSYLTSLAREGFDFNACIYDGISYLSRAQESKAKIIGNPLSSLNVVKSSSTPTIADTVFVQRIKSRIKNWIKTCKNSSSSTSKDEALLTSLRKIVLGNEEFGSRPALTIDVCSKRQVELILEILVDFQKIVPVVIPGKGNTALAIRLVLMKSKEDKDMFERERQILEEKENKKLLGFREVIELISASQKPVLSHNYLNDSTFIHSKFIAPLPPEVDEFIDSLCTVFPHVIDVNRMMKEIGTSRKVTSIPAALSYLKNHFFAPVDMEIPDQTTVNEGKTDGLDALWICYLFMKICTILKINPNVIESGNKHLAPELQKFTNLFHPHSSDTEKPVDDISVWTNNSRRVGCEHLVFLWGFRPGMTASTLKSLLHKSHYVFFGEFDVKLVGKSCAIVVFWEPGLSKAFLDAMNSVEISGSLRELVSDGLRVACYDTYRRVCRLGLWEVDLPESLERALERPDCNLETSSDTKFWDINWCKDNVINLDDL